MPPIRSTPVRERLAEPRTPVVHVPEEDDGFNPAWAMNPENPFRSYQPIAPIEQEPEVSRLPAPQVSVTRVQPQVATYDHDALDSLTWGVLIPLAVVYNTVKGVCDLATGAVYATCRGAKAVARVGGGVSRKVFPNRYDPIGRSRRVSRTPQKQIPADSMLALPPHMVGATPNVVRRARGERLRGDPNNRTPTVDEAKKWNLFHETPLRKKPVVAETPLPNGPGSTPWKTPKFEFNMSQKKSKTGKSKEFAMNVHKGEFKEWLKMLKRHGLGTSTLRRELTENLTFPTNLILELYDNKSEDLNRLVKCLVHEGFTAFYRLNVPVIKPTAPIKFRKGEVRNIDLDAVHQQEDGCCKFCRGFAWAGQVEEREMDKDGEVPCRSQHKTVVPYTEEEKAVFAQNKYDMLFRRWCQESRYDWIFEAPRLKNWEIPQDDPRLRHISMLRQQHKATYGAPKMYDADLLAGRNNLREDITRQDVAAKIMIDAIRKENPALADAYAKLDLERKRRQVRADWLCIRQVKAVRKEPPKKEKAPVKPVVADPPPAPVTALVKVQKAVTKRNAQSEEYDQKPSKRVKITEETRERNGKRIKFDEEHYQEKSARKPEKPARKSVKFAPEPQGPHVSNGNTAIKGILKESGTFEKASQALVAFKKLPPKKKAPTKSISFNTQPQPIPPTGTEPVASGLPEKVPLSQISYSPTTRLLSRPIPKINFAAVPSLRPEGSGSEPTFFFGASSKTVSFSARLPPSFDPVLIRQQYKLGCANAGSYWDDLDPHGWQPDPALTVEENNALRINYNIQKAADAAKREQELRELEREEEAARNLSKESETHARGLNEMNNNAARRTNEQGFKAFSG
ncbi:hypothetical protein BZA05DRAFT_454395 [Tricharina praecox]|uniref:uncharacterized protein n=1 Tax=Tricharina praecox TaxID=43433 RepID=UPI00221FD535|nr:uncharacterized protein BZA05DRAFT_454395 [Tricharina praecox]KAI5850093.1 hypothetical protein BZA05DRAFT_454395 [Tricharina praecox]